MTMKKSDKHRLVSNCHLLSSNWHPAYNSVTM